MPKAKTGQDPNGSWPVVVHLSDTQFLLVFDKERTNLRNIRLHKEYEPDRNPNRKGATHTRFKGIRALQLEIGIRAIRATMAENNRTTIADFFPRSVKVRANSVAAMHDYRRVPWFMDSPY